MTIRLDDPRLAAELVSLVDRRVAAALAAMPQTRYGTVAAVDAATSRVSVRLGANPTASPGFVYPGRELPEVGDLVRVVIAGADRYVEANLSGEVPRYRGLALQRTTAGMTIANATYTNITGWNIGRPFGTNEATYCHQDAGANNYRVVIDRGGLWLMYGHVTWPQGINHRIQGFAYNGAASPASTAQVRYVASNIQSDIFSLAKPELLAAGTTVTLNVWQNRGGSLDISNATLGLVFLGAPQPGDVLAALLGRDRVDHELPEDLA